MLKSTFIPIFATFPTKPTRLFKHRSSVTSVANTFSETQPQTVHQNATPTHLLPPTSAYIHLPFCRKRCHYCDFPIVALGSSIPADTDPRISDYIQLLKQEIVSTNPHFTSNPRLQTVFFGGGTPSLVSPALVLSVLDILRDKFGVCEDAEISMEVDPGTFDYKKMEELVRVVGVNRVSLGVQAFQQELLRACGRVHGVKEVYEAIEIVKSCGVENWSLDLISSLPHQTLEMWEESLRFTVEAGPNHVSVYDLQVEPGTKFGALYTPGEFPLPSETQSADFYRTASMMLSDADYKHYEISSYCKDGFECKHNSIYWKNDSFYGFGLGSTSYVKGLRFLRPRRMREYIGYVDDLENGKAESWGNCQVELKDLAMDVLMLSLRTVQGLDLRSYGEAFGASLVYSLCHLYKPYVESGHVVCLDKERRVLAADEFCTLLLSESKIASDVAYIRLSDPDGFLLSNELISLAFGVIDP